MWIVESVTHFNAYKLRHRLFVFILIICVELILNKRDSSFTVLFDARIDNTSSFVSFVNGWFSPKVLLFLFTISLELSALVHGVRWSGFMQRLLSQECNKHRLSSSSPTKTL